MAWRRLVFGLARPSTKPPLLVLNAHGDTRPPNHTRSAARSVVHMTRPYTLPRAASSVEQRRGDAGEKVVPWLAGQGVRRGQSGTELCTRTGAADEERRAPGKLRCDDARQVQVPCNVVFGHLAIQQPEYKA